MSRFKEIIAKGINLEAKTYTNYLDEVKPWESRDAYLVMKPNGTHDKYVIDRNLNASKQASVDEGVYMLIAEYIINGKIRADKIEALGLTELIKVPETSIEAFALNPDKPEFEKNDIIATSPEEPGDGFRLYIYDGNGQDEPENYIPTGLSNITIPMVEGLQMVLNGKLDKPASSGDFYLSKTIVDGIAYYQYKVINLQPGQIPRSFGGYIGASTLFEDNGGKIGIGTNLPSEQLQLTGRGRMKALVLEENTESLPGQITRSGNRFSGTNASGVKKGFLYNDLDDITSVVSVSTDAQKEAWRLAQRKSDETYSLGQPRVDTYVPSIIDNSLNYYQTVALIGLNLFLNNSSPNSALVTMCRIKDENGDTLDPINDVYATEYPITNFEVYQVNTKLLNIRERFDNWLKGEYSARVVHNGISNIISTSNTLIVRSNIVSQPISLTYKILDQDVNTGSISITDSTSSNISLNNNIGFHTYAAQSNEPVATLQEQIDGVALYFKVIQGPEFNANRDTRSGAALFTLVTQRLIEANDISEISLYKSEAKIYSKPNGSVLDTGTYNLIDDTLVIIFKYNFIKVILVNTGYVSIMSYSPVGDLYLKTLLTYYIGGWQQGSNSIYIEPIKKVNL